MGVIGEQLEDASFTFLYSKFCQAIMNRNVISSHVPAQRLALPPVQCLNPPLEEAYGFASGMAKLRNAGFRLRNDFVLQG